MGTREEILLEENLDEILEEMVAHNQSTTLWGSMLMFHYRVVFLLMKLFKQTSGSRGVALGRRQ